MPLVALAPDELAHRLPRPSQGMRDVAAVTSARRAPPRALVKAVGNQRGLVGFLTGIAANDLLGTGRPVRTAHTVLQTLGDRAVRDYATFYGVRRLTERLPRGDLDAQIFWSHALRRGCAAHWLAEQSGFDSPQTALVVGLVQDVGVLLMAGMWPDRTDTLWSLLSSPIGARLPQERDLFGADHVDFFEAARLAWMIPDELAEAVRFHHHEPPPDAGRRARRLAEIARTADGLADLFQSRAHPRAIQFANRSLADEGLRAVALAEAASRIEERCLRVSAALGIRFLRQPGVVRELANQSEPSETEDALRRQLLEARRERDELLRMLRRVTRELQRSSSLDPITSTLDRSHFLPELGRALDDARAARWPVSLVVVDIDGLARLNHRFGEATGDAVVRAAAQRLSAIIRADDIIGRIAGGTLAMVLPRTPVDGAVVAARRCAHRLRREIVETADGRDVRFTASFGVTGRLAVSPALDPGAFLGEAAACLRRAKARGPGSVASMVDVGEPPIRE